MKFFIITLCFISAHCAINPLTADQANLVKTAWGKVSHSEIDILYNVFKAHPDIQARFPQFVGKDLEGLKDTAAFATHAGRIVGFFSEVIGLIGNLDNAPALKTLVNELATNHKNRGIPKEQFNEFRATLLSYVSSHADWDDATAAAWNQATDNMYFVLFSALDGNPAH